VLFYAAAHISRVNCADIKEIKQDNRRMKVLTLNVGRVNTLCTYITYSFAYLLNVFLVGSTSGSKVRFVYNWTAHMSFLMS